MPISLALASIFGSYADHENRVVLAEKDIVPDNRVKKEKLQRCTSEQHDVPSFGVRLPVLWDMRATPIEGLPNILS